MESKSDKKSIERPYITVDGNKAKAERLKRKTKEVLDFIKKNSGKYKGTEIFWHCDLFNLEYGDIVDDLEKKRLIKWDRFNQAWVYVGHKKRKN